MYDSPQRNCNVVVGPQAPPFEECQKQTTSSPTTLDTTTILTTSDITTTPMILSWKVFAVGGYNDQRLSDTEKVESVEIKVTFY